MVKHIALIFVVCAFFLGACTKPQSETSLLRELGIMPMSGQVPELVLPSLDGQGDISLSSYRDNLIVLSVWVSWCKYCQEEAPYMVRLAEAAKRTPNIKVIGLTVDKDSGAALQHVQKYSLANPVLHDVGGQRINETGVLKIRGTPTTFYIAPSGRMLGKVEGYKEFDPEKKLEQLIALAQVAK